jgi:hypothetical protein
MVTKKEHLILGLLGTVSASRHHHHHHHHLTSCLESWGNFTSCDSISLSLACVSLTPTRSFSTHDPFPARSTPPARAGTAAVSSIVSNAGSEARRPRPAPFPPLTSDPLPLAKFAWREMDLAASRNAPRARSCSGTRSPAADNTIPWRLRAGSASADATPTPTATGTGDGGFRGDDFGVGDEGAGARMGLPRCPKAAPPRPLPPPRILILLLLLLSPPAVRIAGPGASDLLTLLLLFLGVGEFGGFVRFGSVGVVDRAAEGSGRRVRSLLPPALLCVSS